MINDLNSLTPTDHAKTTPNSYTGAISALNLKNEINPRISATLEKNFNSILKFSETEKNKGKIKESIAKITKFIIPSQKEDESKINLRVYVIEKYLIPLLKLKTSPDYQETIAQEIIPKIIVKTEKEFIKNFFMRFLFDDEIMLAMTRHTNIANLPFFKEIISELPKQQRSLFDKKIQLLIIKTIEKNPTETTVEQSTPEYQLIKKLKTSSESDVQKLEKEIEALLEEQAATSLERMKPSGN